MLYTILPVPRATPHAPPATPCHAHRFGATGFSGSPSPLRLRLRLIRSCRAVPVDSIALGQDGARGPALLEGKTSSGHV